MADGAEILELEPNRHPFVGLVLAVAAGLALVVWGSGQAASPPRTADPEPMVPAAVAASTTRPVVTLDAHCAADWSGPGIRACRRQLAELIASTDEHNGGRTRCAVTADVAEHWIDSAGHVPGCPTDRR